MGVRAGRDVARPAASVLGLAVLVGVAWWWLAPTGPVVLAQGYLVPTGDGSGGPPSDVLGATQDAVFTVLAAGGGAVSGLGVAAWRGSPDRAFARWAAVLSTGMLAPVVAWGVAALLGPASIAAQQAAGADPLVSPLRLSSPAPLLVWTAATCAVAFVTTLVSALRHPAIPPARPLPPTPTPPPLPTTPPPTPPPAGMRAD